VRGRSASAGSAAERLASAADGGRTDCQISDLMRNSVDTTSVGAAFVILFWHQSHCVGTVGSEAISFPQCWWIISSLSPRVAIASVTLNRCALPAMQHRPRQSAPQRGIPLQRLGGGGPGTGGGVPRAQTSLKISLLGAFGQPRWRLELPLCHCCGNLPIGSRNECRNDDSGWGQSFQPSKQYPLRLFLYWLLAL